MLNDDLISAYLDGELDAERRAQVERQLRYDKGAAARFERLRAADDVLKQAFPTDLNDNDALASIILADGAPPPRRWVSRIAAIAAAAVFGLLAGRFLGDGADTGAAFAISRQQTQFLNTQVSGRVIDTSEGAFEIVLSLRSDDGEMCRQFRLTRDERHTDVLACRSGAESWRMVAAAAGAVVEGYVPAGASSPLDAAIENLGPVSALTVEEERRLISARWR